MLSEFDFIRNLKKKYSLEHVGEDCAILPKDDKTDLLFTADLLVEDIDFRLEWTTPEFLGHKALAVSLSDIAAMGGEPKWAMLSIGVPEKLWKTDFLDRFFSSWHRLADSVGVKLIGGDVSRSPEVSVFDSILVGEVVKDRAIMRSGARPGDAIFVTGYLGGASAGLQLLKRGERFFNRLAEPTRHLLLRQLQPIPQTTTGKLLQEMKLPTSMIDISDGLSSDLSRLAAASRVGAKLFADKIPIDPAISAVKVLRGDALELALHGGEDYELLFTTRQEQIPTALDLGFHLIGEVSKDVGILELLSDKSRETLKPKGYSHFC